MVNPTSEPGVFRVSFFTEMEQAVATEVHCFVAPERSGGARVLYHCHVWHQRIVHGGPWLEKNQARLELTEPLKAQIKTNVMLELARYAGLEVSVLPYPFANVNAKEGESGEPWLHGLAAAIGRG